MFFNYYSFKIIVIGDSGVGKTSIINRYIKNTFEDNIISTSGVCFSSKIIEFPELKQTCKLDVKYIFIIISMK